MCSSLDFYASITDNHCASSAALLLSLRTTAPLPFGKDDVVIIVVIILLIIIAAKFRTTSAL